MFSIPAFAPMMLSWGPSTMDYNDLILSLLAAAAMGSLACLGLIKTDKKEGKPEFKLDTAGVDTVTLTAVITFIAMMVAHHPEWVA